MWKRATAVLSAVVLLSTFLSLRNFAIAVTEEKAAEAQITEAVQAALAETASAKENDGVTVTNEFTPDEVGINSNLPLEGEVAAKLPEEVSSVTGVEAPETVSTDGTDTSSVGSADSFPSRGSSEAPEAVTTAPEAINSDLPLEGRSTSGGRWSSADRSGAETVAAQLPEEVSSVTGVETTDIVDDPAPLAAAPEVAEASMLRMAPAATLLGASTKATPAQITSAIPTRIRVTQNGNPVGTVYEDSLVEVEIAWVVNDSSEIDAAGDYIVMTLPSEFNFPAGNGSYKLAQTTSGLLGMTYPAGTSLADYTISGNELRLTFTEAGVDLNAAGKLTNPALMGALQWSAMQFSGVSINRLGNFTPEFSINDKTIRNTKEISVLPNQAELLTGAVITSLTLPDATTWSPYNSSWYSRKTVYTETPFTLNLAWDWKSTSQTLSDGDYFEFRLPSQLDYDTYTGRSLDSKGNYSETRVYKDSAGRWVMRVTFLDVVDNYNVSAGNQDITAYVPAYLIGSYDTYASLTLQADVVSGSYNSGKSVSIYARKNSSGSGGGGSSSGNWYIQSVYERYPNGGSTGIDQITDYTADGRKYSISESGTGFEASLFVIADERNKNLSPNPFRDQVHDYSSGYGVYNPNQRVEFTPGASNYFDAYCADRGTTQNPGGSYVRYFMEHGKAFYNVGHATGGSLSETKVDKLYKLLSVSYPYVSMNKMATKFGFSPNVEIGAVVSAVQCEIWNIIHGYNWTVSNYTANSILNSLKNYVNNGERYTPGVSTGGYSFAQGPEITINGNSATVSGRLSGSSFGGVTGTFSNDKGRSTSITVESNGSFKATLYNISASDKLSVKFTWSGTTDTKVWYFTGGSYSNGSVGYSSYLQNVIAAEVTEEEGSLTWEYQEELRDVKVVKRWLDKDGKVVNTWPQGKELTVTLYRQIKGGQPEVVPATAGIENPVTLNVSRSTYTWKNLPVRDNRGNVYHYSVVETGVPTGFDYVGTEPSAEGDTLVFTAINAERQPEKTKVQITKDWLNSQSGTVKVESHVKLLKTNADDSRREPLYVKVRNTVKSPGGDIVYGDDYITTQANGYNLAAWTLNDDNGWKVTFEGLPKYEADGETLARYVVFEDFFVIRRGDKTIEYRVNGDGSVYYEDENGVRHDGGFRVEVAQPVMTDADAGRIPSAVVKNTEDDAETEVSVIKKWAGVPDGKTNGYKVTVQLFRQNKGSQHHGNGTKTAVRIKNRVNTGGTNGQTLIVTGDYTATKEASAADGDIVTADLTKADNSWSVTFKGLPKYEKDGTLIQYLVREVAIYDEDGNVLYETPNGTNASAAYDEGHFVITYDPEVAQYPYGDGFYYSAPDMESEHPTVTVTNHGRDSSLVVIKEWKDATGNNLTEHLPENIKVQLSITKTDGTPIPEALWDLYVQGGEHAKEVYLRKENGYKHSWTVYPTRNVVYNVTEVEVPAGWKNDNPTVTAVKENGIWVVRLLNVLENTEVKIIKYDAKSPRSGLEGAEFDVYESDQMGISSQEHWTKLNKEPLVTDKNGQILLKDIKLNTTYVLIETKPPKGFVRPTAKVIYFQVIMKDGKHQLSFFNHDTSDSGGWDYDQYDPTTMAIRIKNDRITYTLPETGAMGTTGYKTGGALLMSMAALFYITKPMWMDEKRRRRASK